MQNYYLGIDIGGTKIKMVVLNEHKTIIEQNETLTKDVKTQHLDWKNRIIELIREKTKDYSKSTKEGIQCAISAPGLVDVDNKMVLFMPQRLKGIENFDWSKELRSHISVLNDGHAACLAEYESFYRAKDINNLLMLTLGTGVGGGIIINGQLYQGNLQRAGHVGHMSLDAKGAPTMTNMPGSLEYAIGNFSVTERTNGCFKTVRQLVKAYEEEDPKAEIWWLESVEKLAVGLASLTNILSPELIILGGGITAGAGNSLMKPLKNFMPKYEWRPGGYETEIKTAKLGAYAGAVGAAFFARNKFLNNKK